MPSASPHPNRSSSAMSGMQDNDMRPFDGIMMELQGIRDKFKDEDDYQRGELPSLIPCSHSSVPTHSGAC